jgi:exonuclease VII small subunit
MDISRGYKEEEQFKKGEAQLYQMQQQVDELRRLMREQIARQHSLEDSVKRTEANIYSVREVQDKQVQEFSQTNQLQNLVEQRFKQDLAELQVRVGEPIKPLRELRSQILELAEAQRREKEQVLVEKLNLDKIETSIRDLNSQIGRLDGAIKDLREAVKITANAQEFYQRELERILNIVYANEQLAVRTTQELREEIKSVREEVLLYNNRIARLEDLQRQDSARIDEVPPQFEVLHGETNRINSNITRVEKIAAERIAIVQERLEEVRQQAEAQIFSLNQLLTGQAESSNTRIEQLDERIRAVDNVIMDLQLRIEQVKQVEDSEIYELYQLQEMLMAKRLEAIQMEYDYMRQHRTRSQAGGLAGRRAARARARAQTEEAQYGQNNDGDNSI